MDSSLYPLLRRENPPASSRGKRDRDIFFHLATEGKVTVSTQRQAPNALIFLLILEK
jgi:hypothetical protein